MVNEPEKENANLLRSGSSIGFRAGVFAAPSWPSTIGSGDVSDWDVAIF
jgi:hypothetical protein